MFINDIFNLCLEQSIFNDIDIIEFSYYNFSYLEPSIYQIPISFIDEKTIMQPELSSIMYKEKKSYTEAENFVRLKKSDINPNENFVKQLKEFDDIIKVCKYDLKMIKEFCINFTENKYKQNIEIKEKE